MRVQSSQNQLFSETKPRTLKVWGEELDAGMYVIKHGRVELSAVKEKKCREESRHSLEWKITTEICYNRQEIYL